MSKIQAALVIVLVILAVFLVPFVGDEKRVKSHCREESLSTLEAWRMVAIPNYGPPPRNVVQVGEALWALSRRAA